VRALVVQSAAHVTAGYLTRVEWQIGLRRQRRQRGQGPRMSMTQRGRALPDRRVLAVCTWRREASGTSSVSLLLARKGEIV